MDTGLGKQIAGSGFGYLAQDLGPACLLIHAFADQRSIEGRPIQNDGKPAFVLSAQRSRKAKGCGSQRLGQPVHQLRFAGKRLREECSRHPDPAVEKGHHASRSPTISSM